ncbi:Cysteine protease atg4c [Mortierella sp. GBA43]|nr:Cysteine protease atg4c [Mortierella sp. GBA43]
MPARSPRPAATHAAAAAVSPATQKAYHPNDDIAFWSALYSQHPVHTRQDVALETTSSSLHHTSHQRPIKICQVLTKTVLPQDSADPQHPPPVHFERLPIKVQTSASSLSPNGRPFSIVFFFTVESAPTTLWYLDSSFTQSATLHEHMELMGTFQPNSPADPVPFYMYETHTFNITQPAHEDTMLDIRVQSPDGTIYAEFSYTFVSQVTSAPLSPRIDTSHQRSDSRATTEAHPDTTCARSRPHSLEKLKIPSFSPPDTLVSPSTLSPLDGYDMVEPTTPVSPTNLSHGYYAAQPLTAAAEINNTTIGHHIGTLPNPPTRPAHASSHSGLASGDDDHDDNDKELIADTFVDEPDAGEHFIQATSEYWLYNSRVGQYIARDDRSRTKVVFQTEDIWILGICYSFENTEPTCSLPEATRSRKVSTPSARTGDPRISIANGFTLLPDNFRDSKRKTVLQMPSPAPPVPDIDPAHALDSTFQGSESHSGRSRSQERHLHKQRTKELAKAKKVAQAKELAVEREQRMLRKEQEDREKLKSKISGPLFDRNNLRDGTMHISNLHVDPGHNPEPTRITPHDTDRKSRSLHGYQHDERPHLGLGLAMTSSDEIKKNTLRKARSNSILQGVKSAAASRFRKKSVMDVQGQHQLQGQSVSNLSGLSQKSTGVSSFSSYDGPFPNPPPLPLASKSVISFHEAFGAGSGALAKLSLRNLSQKKLPELPRTVNSSMSDQPSDQTYSHDSDGRQVVSLPLPPPDMTEPPDSPKSLRRRMTMTLFIKEPKTTSMNGMAALKKSLANSSRISLRLKPEDGPTTPVAEGPVISESRSLGKPASSKIANWIGWRRSSNNLHQQALAAAAAAEEEPPVPPLDWSHRTISPPSSPVPSPYADGSTATARTTSMHERQYDKNAPQQRTTTTTTTTRPRKKSTLSAKSMSSTLSSPMSPTAPDLPRPLSPIKALNGAISSPHSFSTNGIHSGDPSKGMDLESGDLPNIESTKSSVQPGDDGDDPSDKSSLDLSQQSDQMTSSDPPNFQNLRADLSLSSSSSSDAVPMVPDLTSEQTTGKTSLFDGDQQPIQNSTRLVHTKTMKDFAQGDRERIRKIASTYIKAKNSSSSSSSSPGAATPKDHQETCLDNEKGSTPDSLDPNKTSNSGHTPPGLPSPSVDMNAEGHALDGINQAKDSDACAVPPPSPSRHLYGVSGATTNLSANQMILQQFMSDFRSRLWFTYRKDMARIEPSFYNSDAGWGCMMRTGQSLLAQAFLQVMLGRGKSLFIL